MKQRRESEKVVGNDGRRAAPAPTTNARPTAFPLPLSVADELEARVSSAVVSSVARAIELGSRLQAVGEMTFDATDNLFGSARAEELVRRAHGLQALTSYGQVALAELQAEAGRWETLAAVRQLLEAARDAKS